MVLGLQKVLELLEIKYETSSHTYKHFSGEKIHACHQIHRQAGIQGAQGRKMGTRRNILCGSSPQTGGSSAGALSSQEIHTQVQDLSLKGFPGRGSGRAPVVV